MLSILGEVFGQDLGASLIEAENFMGDLGGPPGFLLVLGVEYEFARFSLARVEDSFGENANQGRFSGVHITNDTDPDYR